MYDLNEKAGEDHFKIQLDGFTYKMVYPPTNDLLKLEDKASEESDMLLEIEKLQEKPTENGEKIAAIRHKLEKNQQSWLDWVTSYITAEEAEAPDFKTALKSKSLKYLKAFTEIIKTELNS